MHQSSAQRMPFIFLPILIFQSLFRKNTAAAALPEATALPHVHRIRIVAFHCRTRTLYGHSFPHSNVLFNKSRMVTSYCYQFMLHFPLTSSKCISYYPSFSKTTSYYYLVSTSYFDKLRLSTSINCKVGKPCGL